jgi:ribosome recycling factor
MQLATISAPEPRLLTIKPFDPGSLKNIERAILASDLGLTPGNDGKLIRLMIPALTEERRRELVKATHHRAEEARVAVRNVRRDVHNDLREFEKEKLISEDDLKRGEEDLQKMTDKMVEKVDDLVKRKETEIMEV